MITYNILNIPYVKIRSQDCVVEQALKYVISDSQFTLIDSSKGVEKILDCQ